jgi:CMP-N-acetylneuraminic acid synthetase
MRILGIIPARGGSKGVPGKNIKMLGGKPLITHTIEVSLRSKLTTTIVSTDDENIACIAKGEGIEVPFIRPPEISGDSAKSIDVALHALSVMEKNVKCQYDAIMLLQPTAPFKSVEDIDRCIEILEECPQADSVISVVDVLSHHPARMKYLEDGKLIDPPFCEAYENQNRQELRPMFIRNGAIYLTRRNTLLQHSYKGQICMAHIMPEIRSINIDTTRDFELAEWTYQQYLS